MSDAEKPWIVWVDYGTEGWAPMEFGTKEDAIRYIAGEAYGQARILTRRYTLIALPTDSETE